MVKEVKKQAVDLDKIISKARSSFGRTEKSLALQLTTGANMKRSFKESDMVLFPGTHWEMLTGVKGIPFGKIVQIAGRPDSGKSSHAMAFMKAAQDAGHVVILWDTENKFSSNRFDKFFGGDSSQLLCNENKVILEGADGIIALAKAALETYPDRKVLIVWDSVGGTITTSENEKDLRQSAQMAVAAKENGKVLHAFVNLMEQYKNKELGEERVAILLVNQVYSNIGAPGQKEAGGQKVEFHSSIILQLTRKADLNKVKDKVKRKIGIVTRAKVRKNHLFDGEDSVAELDLLVTAGGIKLSSEAKVKESDDSWDVTDEEEGSESE